MFVLFHLKKLLDFPLPNCFHSVLTDSHPDHFTSGSHLLLSFTSHSVLTGSTMSKNFIILRESYKISPITYSLFYSRKVGNVSFRVFAHRGEKTPLYTLGKRAQTRQSNTNFHSSMPYYIHPNFHSSTPY